MEQIWNFLSSNEVAVVANLFNIVLAFAVAIYTVVVDRAAKRRDKLLEAEEKKKLTLSAYQELYRNALVPLEEMGTKSDIENEIQLIRSEIEAKPSITNKKAALSANARIKAYKHIIRQIEVFAKILQGSHYYDAEVFDSIANPDFANNMVPRVRAYYTAGEFSMPKEMEAFLKMAENRVKEKYSNK